MRAIDDNLQAVRRASRAPRAAVGRDPASVTLLAVSKTHPAALVEQALAAGQRAFGENYVQEAVEKMDALAGRAALEWHLIGPLQSNKTRLVAARFDWVHSVESEKIARRLSEQRPAGMAPLQRPDPGERIGRGEQERRRAGGRRRACRGDRGPAESEAARPDGDSGADPDAGVQSALPAIAANCSRS